jgi:hypothetical protein
MPSRSRSERGVPLLLALAGQKRMRCSPKGRTFLVTRYGHGAEEDALQPATSMQQHRACSWPRSITHLLRTAVSLARVGRAEVDQVVHDSRRGAPAYA